MSWLIGVASIFSGVHFFLKKLMTFFSRCPLNTRAKTAKLTIIPTVQPSLSSKNFLKKIHFLLCLGVRLQ